MRRVYVSLAVVVVVAVVVGISSYHQSGSNKGNKSIGSSVDIVDISGKIDDVNSIHVADHKGRRNGTDKPRRSSRSSSRGSRRSHSTGTFGSSDRITEKHGQSHGTNEAARCVAVMCSCFFISCVSGCTIIDAIPLLFLSSTLLFFCSAVF